MKRSFFEDLEELEMDAEFALAEMMRENRSPNPPSIKPARDAFFRKRRAEVELDQREFERDPRNLFGSRPTAQVSNSNILSIGADREGFSIHIQLGK